MAKSASAKALVADVIHQLMSHEAHDQLRKRARIKAELKDFHFHDFRHMAITRLAEKLPNLVELSTVSGHKSLAMLKRYYHPNPEELAQKIGQINLYFSTFTSTFHIKKYFI